MKPKTTKIEIGYMSNKNMKNTFTFNHYFILVFFDTFCSLSFLINLFFFWSDLLSVLMHNDFLVTKYLNMWRKIFRIDIRRSIDKNHGKTIRCKKRPWSWFHPDYRTLQISRLVYILSRNSYETQCISNDLYS